MTRGPSRSGHHLNHLGDGMAKFTSKYASLVLQDDKGVWAEFHNGELETDDTRLAERLRKVEYVTEVEVEAVEEPAGE